MFEVPAATVLLCYLMIAAVKGIWRLLLDAGAAHPGVLMVWKTWEYVVIPSPVASHCSPWNLQDINSLYTLFNGTHILISNKGRMNSHWGVKWLGMRTHSVTSPDGSEYPRMCYSEFVEKTFFSISSAPCLNKLHGLEKGFCAHLGSVQFLSSGTAFSILNATIYQRETGLNFC